VIELGIFRIGEPLGRVIAPHTGTGSVRLVDPLRDPVLETPTRRVPARLGTRFGLRFRVDSQAGASILRVRVRVLHPPLTGPGGVTRTLDEWDMDVNAGLPRYTGWAFDEAWELVPGRWTFQILLAGALLLEEAFDVEPAGDQRV
jgi:hypothetical protein